MSTIEPMLSQIGRNLQQVRTEKGSSVQELAACSDVDEETIIKIESGKLDFQLGTIFSLSAGFDIDFRRIIVDNVDH